MQALRSIDWRFLLPLSRPGRVACSSPAVHGGALSLIAAEVLPLERQPRECDVVTLTDPGAADLRLAYRALRPGGAVHVRWSRPCWRPSARLHTRGFVSIELYWRWPADFPRLWLPFGAAAPMTHALSRRLNQRPRAAEAGALVARGAAMFAPASFGPLTAIARRPPVDEVGPLAALTSTVGSSPLARSLRAPGDSDHNKLVSLLFRRDDPRPVAVVKQARINASAAALAQEARVLTALAERAPTLPGVPRLLSKVLPDAAIAQTPLAGMPMLRRLDVTTFPAIGDALTKWLVLLARATRGSPAETAAVTTTVIDEFRRRFTPVLGRAAAEAIGVAARSLPAVPSVLEHRDLSPWNVLLGAHGQPAVLDWESAELHGVPGTDLSYFLAYTAFSVDGAQGSGELVASYRRLLDPATPTGMVARRCETRYAADLGIPPSALGPIRVLTWMIHACANAARQDLAPAGEPNAWSALETYLNLCGVALERSG